MKKLAFVFIVLSAANVAAQRIVSFEQLQERKITKKISWVNPDSTHEEVEIIQMRIPVDKEFKDQTRRFMRDNYGRSSIWVETRMIVIHSMNLGDLKPSLEQSSFLDRYMPSEWRTQVKAGTLPSGAHFIIDRDGTIYCLTPPSLSYDDSKISYHRDYHKWLIRRHLDANPMSLGIENVTPADTSFQDLTDEQITANAQLVRWLLWMEKGAITHVMSHHQFNDTTRFDAMLKEFKLELPRPMFRAWTREDVGDVVLEKIVGEVRRRGWLVREDF